MSLENYADAPQVRTRRPKRPSIQAMIKAAKKAGLQISSIECDEDGVKLICGAQTSRADTDENELDRRMTEQMGVTRLGGRKRR
jgi:hypothetical protein